ncbi:DUF3798 domain-containing protein [Lacrimispora sp. 210928-DFI.3.58]|uniref:DUF3798 domain-containing protein n=1 Tax=Lacrimispora sp. 210928-DFI.3.58 TaxID=2883214 RepID=UPI001D07299A|nr:DUF3798 domain-containing protein [Lacrimispora sp. 210928-DFI.3.58]MCB7320409.1 DUF3798 domain-containing protein [Lacrimispora sp. 210928-DFI.3.58]
MKKRLLSLTLAAVMAFSMVGCGSKTAATEAPTTAAPAAETTEAAAEEAVTEAAEAASESDGNWKIAILTGTVSQGEEEFRAAEKALATYGPEHIVTATYPDNFMSEMETTVSQIVSFASDPDVKAIVMCQAVPGAKAGFDKVREMGRDDILLIAGTPQEDPAVIAAAADIVMYADEAAQGDTIMEKCAEWGIDVLVHYSFPRHMAMELIVARHELLQKNADALGIELVDVTAPDPTAEAGLSASQQFILEDVPQQLKKYEGKKVAFFTTNCGMQPSLQAACLDEPNAYYPQPCCPSPYHAFPATLGLELAIGGDDEEALTQIAAKLQEHDAVGRFSTWASPVAMTIIEIGVEYAKAYIEGEVAEKNDSEKLKEMFNNKVEGAKIGFYKNAEGTEFDNYYTILLAPIDFNDYLK